MPVELPPIGPRKNTARLAWETKPRRELSVKDLEFQTAEVVYPNPAQAQQKLNVGGADEVDPRSMNRLIWGDCLLAMQGLISSGYEGKVDLIYIDPPFLTSEDYCFEMELEGIGEVTKEASIIERLAYTDTWSGGVDSYLGMLLPRLQLMRRLLAENGSLYVHIGPNMSHYVKVLLDEVFGPSRYVNEVVWRRTAAHNDPGRFGRIHDSILFYSKGDEFIWNPQFVDYTDDALEATFHYAEVPDGSYITLKKGQPVPEAYRRFQTVTLRSPHPRPNLRYEYKGYKPHPNGWAVNRERMEQYDREKRLFYPSDPGGALRLKMYRDESPGVPLQDLWTDVNKIEAASKERTGFETQKPKDLLKRIISASSNPGSLVADFFAGSGTTGVAAEELGRRWIMSDFSKVAVQVSRTRLVEEGVQPFAIENVGNYQREMIYARGGRIAEMQRIVLKLFGATPHPTYPDLGIRSSEGGDERTLVFAGYPDRPVTAKKTIEMARLASTLDGDGYAKLVTLGWDYDYNYDATLESLGKKRILVRHASDASRREFVFRLTDQQTVVIEPRIIPPSIYEYLRKAKSAEDISGQITFHEKPYLRLGQPKVRHVGDGQSEVSLGLQRYVLSELPLDDAKQVEEVRSAAKDNFAILIDYWAVDWDYDGTTFRSRWQAVRGNGKNLKTVPKTATTNLPDGKDYRVVVRVVDVFGNDASGEVAVNLPGEA